MKIASSMNIAANDAKLWVHPTNLNQSSDPIVQLGRYWYSTGAGGQYIHFKTNIPIKTNIMYHIQFEGYNYGNGLPVDLIFTGYTYGTWDYPYNHSAIDYTGGLQQDGVYASQDGYVVLRVKTTSTYYLGFIINAMFPCPNGRWHAFSILEPRFSSAETTEEF